MSYLRCTSRFSNAIAVTSGSRLLWITLAASMTLCLFGPSQLFAQSRDKPLENPPKFLFLLPEGFHGWICVDFGVKGAAPLPREGDVLVVRPREGLVMETSEDISPLYFYGEARFEINGARQPLPDDGFVSPGFSRIGPNESTQRACDFVGSTDERDRAGTPPGFERPSRNRRLIPTEERKALEALYRATDGEHWTHRMGWMGPVGTECDWHGVICMQDGHSERVIRLELGENNLSGKIPADLVQLQGLESLSLDQNKLTGEIPSALAELRHLTELNLLGNRFSRMVPSALLQMPDLDVAAETVLLTDISEVDFESSPSSLLCASRLLIFRSDDSVISYEEKCRNATPEDRTTFCEVKEGKSYGALVAMGTLLDKYAFFKMNAKYSRNVTDATFESTRVTTKSGTSHAVVSYAGGGPFDLWIIDRVVEGVAASVEWGKTSMRDKCPRW
jgi:hypothetical protein